jgi:hypothetical protein
MRAVATIVVAIAIMVAVWLKTWPSANDVAPTTMDFYTTLSSIVQITNYLQYGMCDFVSQINETLQLQSFTK